MDSEVIIFIIFGIAITVGLFFLFRLITCWYFKINKRVSLLEQQVNLLSEINYKLDRLIKISSSKEEN